VNHAVNVKPPMSAIQAMAENNPPMGVSHARRAE
jgi:hypothetical protein